MPPECLAQEPFGGSEVSPLAKPEFDRVAIAVDRPVKIHPPPPDFDIRFIYMPPTGDGSPAAIEALQQQRRVMDSPTMDCSVINGDAALRHQLFQIPEAEIVGQIPSDAEQDYGSIEMSALEHATLHP